MKVLSLDIETTAIDPNDGVILEIGAIFADTNKPQPLDKLKSFNTLINSQIYGTIDTLVFNQELLVSCRDTFEQSMPEAIGNFNDWLDEFDKTLTPCGKNVASFDLRWLFYHGLQSTHFRHRCFDVGMEWLEKEDESIPNMKTCLQRAGLDTQVKHRALDDAYQNLQLIWKKRELI